MMPRITLSARRGAANQRVGVAGVVVVVVVATVVIDIVEVSRVGERRRAKPPVPRQQPFATCCSGSSQVICA